MIFFSLQYNFFMIIFNLNDKKLILYNQIIKNDYYKSWFDVFLFYYENKSSSFSINEQVFNYSQKKKLKTGKKNNFMLVNRY